MTRVSELIINFLLNAAWQIVAITIAAAIGARLLRQAPARYRHALWVAALFLSIALPLWSVFGFESKPKLIRDVAPASTREAVPVSGSISTPGDSVKPDVVGDAQAPPVTSLLVRRRHEVETSRGLLWLLVVSYLIFVSYQLLRLARSWQRQRILRRCAFEQATSPNLEQILGRCRAAFHLDRVNLRWSAVVSAPMTVGALNRLIVLPEVLSEESREETLLSVVGHEMAHVIRRDFAINFMCEITRLFISFHPCSQFIKSRIDRDRELACDELVTERLVAPEDYARSLLQVARASVQPASQAFTLSIFDADNLEERIMKLTQNRRRLGLRVGRAIFVAVCTALSLSAITISTFSFDLRLATNAPATTSMLLPSAVVSLAASVQGDSTREAGAASTPIRSEQPLTSAGAQERAQAACDAARNQVVEAIPMLIAMLGDDRPIQPLKCWEIGRWSPALQTFKQPSPGEAAAIALASMGRPAFGPLTSELGNSNSSVRRNAAWAIGELTGMIPGSRAGAVPQLLSLLTDSDTWVRMAAARSLGELADERAGASLIRALSDSQWQVRELAAWALSELRDERAVKALCHVLLTDTQADVRRSAARALGEIKSHMALATLKQALNDLEPRVRASVSWAISEIEDDG